MFGNPFYHRTIKKYVILMGTLFNEMFINRYDKESNLSQTIEVPIAYAPRDKMMARMEQDPSLSKQIAISLPRMSFEMTGVSYDSSRKLTTTTKNYTLIDGNKEQVRYQYVPVPYNFNFQLHIYVKNAEDGTKILEQILPYFTPDWTATVELIPEMNINMDIPVVLNSVSMQDLYEGNFEQRRVLIWTLEFTLKGYLFGPTKKVGLIKFAEVNFIDNTTSTNKLLETIEVYPGLLANGSPTTDPLLTIPYTSINADDDYGFIVRIV